MPSTSRRKMIHTEDMKGKSKGAQQEKQIRKLLDEKEPFIHKQIKTDQCQSNCSNPNVPSAFFSRETDQVIGTINNVTGS